MFEAPQKHCLGSGATSQVRTADKSPALAKNRPKGAAHMQESDELRQDFGHCQQHVMVGVGNGPLGLPLLPLDGVQTLLER